MNDYLLFSQIFVGIVLIILVLLQQRGSSLGSVFGGTSEFYVARRGMEKKILWATIIFTILFVVLALLSLLI